MWGMFFHRSLKMVSDFFDGRELSMESYVKSIRRFCGAVGGNFRLYGQGKGGSECFGDGRSVVVFFRRCSKNLQK